MENEVIVIGGNHHNTLGVIRALGEKGLKPSLLLVSEQKKAFVTFSKYLKRTIQLSQYELVPDALLANFRGDYGKAVVICCSDAASSIIDENYDKLSRDFFLPGSEEQGRITYFMSKKVMSELAVSVGLNIPNTFYVTDKDNIQTISFPCIIKPLVSIKGSKNDICIINDIDELKNKVSGIDVDNVQIQEYINKDFEYQLIGCSVGDEVIIPGVSHILRPCEGSNTSFLKYLPLENYFCEIEKCKAFIRQTGYKGLFSLEFLRDKNGKDYFMEMNFRNDGNAICVTAGGVNLPYIWYLACIGKDYSIEKEKKINIVYVMPDMAELKLLLTRQISLWQYLGDLFKTNRFMEFDRHDKKPFWQLIRSNFIRR